MILVALAGDQGVYVLYMVRESDGIHRLGLRTAIGEPGDGGAHHSQRDWAIRGWRGATLATRVGHQRAEGRNTPRERENTRVRESEKASGS